MLWRHLCLVRAWSAAGLLGLTVFGTTSVAHAGDEPAPRPESAGSEIVSILDARKAGDLKLELRGAGQDKVKLTVKNTSAKRLNVILPPGLVASSAAAQGRGGGGGLQSMGLGGLTNRPGTFGEFRGFASAGNAAGLRSVGVQGEASKAPSLGVASGETVTVMLSSVCLNFGLDTPTPRDSFELVDVDDYSTEPRVRKALKSLATYGTSVGVAQSVMWRVCNDVPFAVMAERAPKQMNVQEVTLAARFVEALDASSGTELVDPAYLQDGRVFVRVVGDKAQARDAERLTRELDGLKIFGLPARAYVGDETKAVVAPAVLISVRLTSAQAGETRAQVGVSTADLQGGWNAVGKLAMIEPSALSVLDGATLARSLDRSVGSAFVTIKPSKKGTGTTTFRVDNRFPFTVARLTVKAGTSSGSPAVDLDAVGVPSGRFGLVTVPAASATVEHVELNGL